MGTLLWLYYAKALFSDQNFKVFYEIMLNIMQNIIFDFLENEFWADWGVCFKLHLQNLV